MLYETHTMGSLNKLISKPRAGDKGSQKERRNESSGEPSSHPETPARKMESWGPLFTCALSQWWIPTKSAVCSAASSRDGAGKTAFETQPQEAGRRKEKMKTEPLRAPEVEAKGLPSYHHPHRPHCWKGCSISRTYRSAQESIKHTEQRGTGVWGDMVIIRGDI